MNEKTIQKLYNRLFEREGQFAQSAYPIHKKLDVHAFGYDDIYEWIGKSYTFDKNTSILDAGCGVGYGSMHLANEYQCSVTGISLSDKEIKQATLFSKKRRLDHLVQFKCDSYDTIQPNSYDFIIAVESIKHSLDFQRTFSSLKKALKKNGILLIIEDVMITEKNKKLPQKYAEDWSLKKQLTYDLFQDDFLLKKDFTSFMITKHWIKVELGIYILKLLSFFSPVFTIIRGGLYLEKLFRLGIFKYYAMEFKNVR
jgi:cyclopropane fatty-acyl-phospholipid synthase-like methyltransferase